MMTLSEVIVNTETTPKNTVEMLREARKEAKLTQAQLADKYQIPLRTLQAWENKERTPPEYVLNTLLRCLVVDYATRLKRIPKDGDKKYAVTYVDGSLLSNADLRFALDEVHAKRAGVISVDSSYTRTYLCSNGFLFKVRRA